MSGKTAEEIAKEVAFNFCDCDIHIGKIKCAETNAIVKALHAYASAKLYEAAKHFGDGDINMIYAQSKKAEEWLRRMAKREC